MKQGRRALQFIFSSLMDICHLKNAELEAKHQKYEGRVLLQGDIVKDDSGAYAVFTEQGSSASQMTAAKIMDGQGDGGPQGMSITGGGGLARVPNVRVCYHLSCWGGTCRGGRMN